MALTSPQTFNPDANVETTSVDGNSALQTQTTWALAHDSANGNSTSDIIASGRIARAQKVTASSWTVQRAMFLFDISTIGPRAIITGVTFGLAGNATAETNTDSPNIDLVTCTLASNTAVVNADFNKTNFGTTLLATSLALSAWVETSGTYNVWTLNATGIAHVQTALDTLSGIVKLGVRISRDTADSAPTGDNSFSAFYADQGASKPQLIVSFVYRKQLACTGVGA